MIKRKKKILECIKSGRMSAIVSSTEVVETSNIIEFDLFVRFTMCRSEEFRIARY